MSRSAPYERPDVATGLYPGWERWILVALFVVQVALRMAYTMHHDVDSDESQHLHVTWEVAQGHLQYRDVFDNHAPLFHALTAPLVRALGERPNILIPLRIAMVPIALTVLWATWWIGRRLFTSRVALWTVALTGLWPDLLLTSSEYRTDVLWAALWLLALAVLVSGRLSLIRCGVAGILLGATLCVSMKTALLLLSLGGATFMVLLMRTRGAARAQGQIASQGAVTLLGLLLPPLAVTSYFASRGAGHDFFYCVITHNIVPGLGIWHKAPHRPWLFTLAVPPLWWAGRELLERAPHSGLGARRALIGLTAGIYVAALYSFWPLITRQDFLPWEALVAIVLTPVLLATMRPAGLGARKYGGITRAVWAAPILLAALEITRVVLTEPPWQDHTLPQTRLLADVLQLTGPKNYVMDLKGETVFRARPFYYAIEGVTKTRIAAGLIRDNVAECMVKTRTCVAVEDNRFFPDSARAYMNAHYLSVGRLRVLGHMVVGGDAGEPSDTFELEFPERFAVVSRHGCGDGYLDGRRYVAPVRLGVGRHIYRPGPGEDSVAVIWAQAAEHRFTPFASGVTTQ